MRRVCYILAAMLAIGGSVRADQGWQDNQDGNNFACYNASSFSANNLNQSGAAFSSYSTGQIVSANPNSSVGNWYVDPIGGNDANDCTSNVTACKTFAEWGRRMIGAFGVSANVFVLNDVPDSDSIYVPCDGSSVTFIGTETVLSTQTVASAQARAPASNLANEITVSGFNWTPFLNDFVRVQGTSNYASVIKVVGSGVARLSELWNMLSDTQASSAGIGAGAVVEIVRPTKGPLSVQDTGSISVNMIDIGLDGSGPVSVNMSQVHAAGDPVFERVIYGGTSFSEETFGIFKIGGLIKSNGIAGPGTYHGTAVTAATLSVSRPSSGISGSLKARSIVTESTQVIAGIPIHVDGDWGGFDIPSSGVGISLPGVLGTGEGVILAFNSGRYYGTGDPTAEVWSVGNTTKVFYRSATPPTNTAGNGVAINGGNVAIGSLPVLYSVANDTAVIDGTAVAGCLQQDSSGNVTSTGLSCGGGGTGTVTTVTGTPPIFITSTPTTTPNVTIQGALVSGSTSTTAQDIGAISTAPLGCVTSGGVCTVDGLTLSGGLNFNTGTGAETLANMTCGSNTFVSSATTSGGLQCTQPTIGNLANIGANTVVSNPTGSSAAPTTMSLGTTSGVMEYVNGSPDTIAVYSAGSARIPFGSGTNGQQTDSAALRYGVSGNGIIVGTGTAPTTIPASFDADAASGSAFMNAHTASGSASDYAGFIVYLGADFTGPPYFQFLVPTTANTVFGPSGTTVLDGNSSGSGQFRMGNSSTTNGIDFYTGGSRTTRVHIASAGDVDLVAMAAPSTPASGLGAVYVDSTSKNICAKNDAGTINHGVQSVTQTAGLALSAVDDTGAWSKLAFQPPLTACTNYVSVSCQGGTSDIGTGGSNSAVQAIGLHDGSLVRWPTAGGWANGFYLGLSGGNIRALSTPTKLHWMILDNVPAAGSAIITSSTAFNASATLEYPNDFLAGHIQTKVNFFASVGAANFSCFATLNGSGIAGTSLSYTGTLGVQTSTLVPTSSASINDTYGVECSPAGGGGGTINFSYEVVLTP